MRSNHRSIWYSLLTAAIALVPLQGYAQSHGAALPDDVHPESYSRLPLLNPDDLDAEGKAAYEFIVGDGNQPRTGPVPTSMHSPGVARAWHMLNNYLRFEGQLTPRQFEVAILAVAWEINQQYEWSAHEPAAVRVGVPQRVIDTIKYDRPINGLSHEDTLIIQVGRQLMRENKLSPELYAATVEHFGEQRTVELLTIMGNYVMVGMVLNAIDQKQPPDRPALLPAR